MTDLTGPFFEIGPKNLLRRPELESLARSAGAAGTDHGVCVVLTVPTALIAPVRDLDTGALVFGQGMDPDGIGPSVGRVTAESLLDAGASGVMLNHNANPMAPDQLAAAVERAHATGLQTILCANTVTEALHLAELDPTAILVEPPTLIGTSGTADRSWIPTTNDSVRNRFPGILLMHAGGVSTPSTAWSIMALGADGTGSTSGVLSADDPPSTAPAFVAAARAGWDIAQRAAADHDRLPHNHRSKEKHHDH